MGINARAKETAKQEDCKRKRVREHTLTVTAATTVREWCMESLNAGFGVRFKVVSVGY